MSVVAFALVFLTTVGLWAWFFGRIVRFITVLGEPSPERFEDVGGRLGHTFKEVVLQKALLRGADGFWHLIIFYGFIVITFFSTEMIVEGFVHGFPAFLAGTLGPVYSGLVLLQEIFAALILFVCLLSFYRRLVQQPVRLENTWKHKADAMFCLGLIIIMMVTIVTDRGAMKHTAEAHAATFATEFRFAYLSQGFAALVGGLSEGVNEAIVGVSWWTHVVVLLGFLAWLPHSKHFHIFSAIPNVFFHRRKPFGMIEVLEIDEENLPETFGKSRIEHFTWKDILDLYTCMECGRCQEACPAYNTGKTLNPRQLIWDMRDHLETYGNELVAADDPAEVEREDLVQDRVTDPVLWACTTCAGCVTHCPVGIEHVQKIIDMRQHLSLTESRFSPEVQEYYENLERYYNPYAMNNEDRAKWTEDLDFEVPIRGMMDETPDVLWWVGCAGSFDTRNQGVSRAFAKILNEAGVSYAILGPEELCNGESCRRMGNEYLGQILTKMNVETLNGYDTKKIVTACPHCFNTLKNDYPNFDGDFEVEHHSQFISGLIADGTIEPDKGEDAIVYHDACYLGRWNKEYDAPRDVVDAGGKRLEPERSREHGFCCGAGGGRMWMEETEGKRINVERVEELLGTSPDAIGTSCPFCMTMMTDGLKAKDAEEDVEVRDIAEIVAASIGNGSGDSDGEA